MSCWGKGGQILQGYTRDACGSPAAVSPNVSSSGLALRLALAKGENSEQIWPGTRNFAKLKLLMFHVRVFLLDAP